MAYLSTKIVNRSALDNDNPVPFKHWREAWLIYPHNQFKFSHELDDWNRGTKSFNIKIWKDMQLIVAYKYCLKRRFDKALEKIKEEAKRRGWNIDDIDFSDNMPQQ